MVSLRVPPRVLGLGVFGCSLGLGEMALWVYSVLPLRVALRFASQDSSLGCLKSSCKGSFKGLCFRVKFHLSASVSVLGLGCRI